MSYYFTTGVQFRARQLTFEDVLNGVDIFAPSWERKDTHNTATFERTYIPNKIYDSYNIPAFILEIKKFNQRYSNLYSQPREELYHTYYIPKRSGGVRRIDEPLPEMKEALTELKVIFERFMRFPYHNAAFAYVKKRSTKMAVEQHTGNGSRWYLKLDFHDFFGSTTGDFIVEQFKTIFPFSHVMHNTTGKTEIEKAVSLCLLNGGLPQGSPISPLLTNIMMIPIDHAITKYAQNEAPHLVYTRYADDILISCKYDFKWKEVESRICKICSDFDAPFEINSKKTRYGSNSGRNWNLGVMVTRDNRITVGTKRKKQFKSMLYNFVRDCKNGVEWDYHSVQVLNGQMAYYKMIEPDYVSALIKEYSEKLQFNISLKIKQILSA